MNTKLLMGNEAIALGALRAGVRFLSGYPGTPSTEILETAAKEKKAGVYIEWSVNEKSALEAAAGAAWAGARAMVTMKQVGLNVASDPLMSLNYVGVKGGMVVVVADDPGPISSQTEQDTRHFGRFAKIAVFDPSSPEEAYTMVADAFETSQRIGRPVILRPTTRVCHGYASVQLLPDIAVSEPAGFQRETSRRVIFPRLSYENHILIEKTLAGLKESFSEYGGNRLTGSGRLGIAAGGVGHAYVCEALSGLDAQARLLKVATEPFPTALGEKFLRGLERVLVVEELDPVIETGLIELAYALGIRVDILGKKSGDMPVAGEYTARGVEASVRAFLGLEAKEIASPEAPPLPVRPPVLCAGCPHRASFFAVKEACKGRKAVFSGDIGCYTLGNAMPLDMVDTCLCMGAGITAAQGLHRIEPDADNFAFIGDSTFFHTGIPGVINAVYNGSDIVICILDNRTTAMTGNQPHPGIGRRATGEAAPKADIGAICAALGVDELIRVDAFDFPAAKRAVQEMLAKKGVRVLLFEGPCIAVDRGRGPIEVDRQRCTGCAACVRRLGCPALTMQDGKAEIDQALCTGCGLCANVCAFGALGGEGA